MSYAYTSMHAGTSSGSGDTSSSGVASVAGDILLSQTHKKKDPMEEALAAMQLPLGSGLNGVDTATSAAPTGGMGLVVDMTA